MKNWDNESVQVLLMLKATIGDDAFFVLCMNSFLSIRRTDLCWPK